MNLALILIAALLPAILLWIYIWKQDPQPEPTIWLVKAVLWGVGICIPVAVLEMCIETIIFGVGVQPSSIIGTTTIAFVVAALPEETFKLLALWIVLRKNPYFDEHFDGIVYAVCVGLGFAAMGICSGYSCIACSSRSLCLCYTYGLLLLCLSFCRPFLKDCYLYSLGSCYGSWSV